jgi:hemolysin activation/secretion protein
MRLPLVTIRPALGAVLGCLFATALPSQAQDLRHTAPPDVPPLPPAGPPPGSQSPAAPVANEAPLLAALKGIVLVPDASAPSVRRLAAGVDATAVPLAHVPTVAAYLEQALGRPASLATLQRMADGISRLLREQGKPFVSVWVPPQDLTDGVVRLVVRPALTEGPVQVVGATYFNPRSYLAWIRQEPGTVPDARLLQEDIDWINRNPFRNATLAAEPGSAPDTTRLTLRVRERRPFRIFAGVDNTGTRTTDAERVFAGLNWGNAFGRADQLSYQYRADPASRRNVTHSGSYVTDLPWRHSLALSAAWSRTTPDLGPAFDQTGTSWQVGTRYLVPLPQGAMQGATIRQDVSVGLDFKYSDNNLDFAAIPVTQNRTHVAQLTLAYSLTREAADSSTHLSPQLVVSPGRLTKYNDRAAFDGSRTGAPARYAYVRLDGDHSQRLPADLRWDVRASLQYSAVPLLGSEQVAGTGAYAVRGYPESGAYGDSGVQLSNELHLPPFQWAGLRDASLEMFVFHDAAWLHTTGPDAGSFSLGSVGLGAVLRWSSQVALDVAYARPLRHGIGGENGSRVHFRLQLAY